MILARDVSIAEPPPYSPGHPIPSPKSVTRGKILPDDRKTTTAGRLGLSAGLAGFKAGAKKKPGPPRGGRAQPGRTTLARDSSTEVQVRSGQPFGSSLPTRPRSRQEEKASPVPVPRRACQASRSFFINTEQENFCVSDFPGAAATQILREAPGDALFFDRFVGIVCRRMGIFADKPASRRDVRMR